MALHEVISFEFRHSNESIISVFASSNLLSNDAQMRCNFVDLYYALYGIKRPAILLAPDTSSSTSIISGMPRIPKLSDKLRSESPCEAKPTEINITDSTSREPTQLYKREPELIINDDHYSIKDEQPELMKVSLFGS